MTRIIVGGPIANKPGNGGIAWNVLSYVRGLEKLGHEVTFVEAIAPESCVDQQGAQVCFEDSTNFAYFQAVVAQLGLPRSVLVYNRGDKLSGATPSELTDEVRRADLLINISGNLPLDPPFEDVPHKVYIDEDPGYTQFWQVAGVDGLNLVGHDHYFTIGENIGRTDCSIPCGDFDWQPTRQPVVLDDWLKTPAPHDFRFTTVGSWRGAYGAVEFEGRHFGLKAHEFRKFLGVPTLVDGARFEIALNIHEGDARDLDALIRTGWHIADPGRVASDPVSFRDYVQSSSAEFSVAQGIYVDTNSGWFSDRSARYLAAGRPVLVQDTGFAENIPEGEGLLSFRDLDEAVAGVQAIREDYERHARTARALAESHFSSGTVLSNLLEQVL